MDSFDDFEFKPLTEGLGFNRNADQKTVDRFQKDLKPLRANAKVDLAPRFHFQNEASMDIVEDLQLDSEVERELIGREVPQQSKSISDLISSLPPSLDFIADHETSVPTKTRPEIELNLNVPEGGRPQIFQPFAREDFKTGASAVNIDSHAKAPIANGAKMTNIATGSSQPTPAVSLASLENSWRSKSPAPGTNVGAAKAQSPYLERLNESFTRAFPHADRKLPTANATSTATSIARGSARETEKLKAIGTNLDGLQPLSAHFGSGFLDGMVVVGVSAIFLASIVGITHVNLIALLTNVSTDGPTQVHVTLLVLASWHLYLLTARSFFGASLGEWAFDLQLGSTEDQNRAFFPLQVAWRTILVTITGLVTLPLLSKLFRCDLASYVTGLQLYYRKI